MAFARHTTGLGLFNDPYMVNSTYRLSLGRDLPFSAAWFSNPKGFGNQLVVDGRTIPHGTGGSSTRSRVRPGQGQRRFDDAFGSGEGASLISTLTGESRCDIPPPAGLRGLPP